LNQDLTGVKLFLNIIGLYVYQIYNNGEGVKPGWPNHINTVFYGLEGDLDAAATRENGKTYFFKVE